MTVVVTGAAGLLGRHLVEAVDDSGFPVRAVDRVPPPFSDVEFVRADLTVLGEAVQALQGASAVMHAAAIPRPTGLTAVEVFQTNVTVAYNVVEAAVIHAVPRLVNASSFSVIGLPFNPRPVRLQYLPIDISHPLAPQEAYALSKLVTEEIVAAATRRSGLSAISLRMPWIQTPATFADEVVARREDATVGAANLWAYIDARDAAAAFLAALQPTISGHEAVYLSAPDTFMDAETEALVHATLAEVELRKPLPGRAPLLDTDAADALLGCRAEHSWRSYPTEAA